MNSSSHIDSHSILSWFTFCSWKWLCYQHVPVYVLQFMSRGFEQASYPCDFHIGAKVSGCFIVSRWSIFVEAFMKLWKFSAQCCQWLKYWKVNIFLKFMYSLIVSMFVCFFYYNLSLSHCLSRYLAFICCINVTKCKAFSVFPGHKNVVSGNCTMSYSCKMAAFI